MWLREHIMREHVGADVSARICHARKCRWIVLLVYTTVLYAATDILYRLCKASTVLFRTLQFTGDLLDNWQFTRVFLILAVHSLFVSIWYFKRLEIKDLQSETHTLCRDNSMSVTVTMFKNRQLENVYIKSLYNSMFWPLLVIDLNICTIVPRTLIKLLLLYYSKSSVASYCLWMINTLLFVFKNRCGEDKNFKL
jgi:hypothetical protein